MNPRLIRVVTSQFGQLQGLHTAAYGLAVLLFAFLTTLPNHDAIDGVVRMMVWLAPTTFLAWANHAIPRFYARRFGRVVRKGPWDRPDWRFILLLFIAVVLLPKHAPAPILWIVWLGYPFYIVFLGWPYRVQHLLIAAAAGYVVSRHLSVAGWSTRALTGFDMYPVGIALVVAGLIDHVVLAHALPSNPEALTAADEA